MVYTRDKYKEESEGVHQGESWRKPGVRGHISEGARVYTRGCHGVFQAGARAYSRRIHGVYQRVLVCIPGDARLYINGVLGCISGVAKEFRRTYTRSDAGAYFVGC